MCDNAEYFSSNLQMSLFARFTLLLWNFFPATSPMGMHTLLHQETKIGNRQELSETNYTSWKQRCLSFEESCFLTLLHSIKYLFGLPSTAVVSVCCERWLGYFGLILNSCKMPFCLEQAIFMSSS
uniref:Uncharacterized protein n=1 Tax=Micrurus corallinus TaxID=54390 RepID=A0A2D4EPR7_MICCO